MVSACGHIRSRDDVQNIETDPVIRSMPRLTFDWSSLIYGSDEDDIIITVFFIRYIVDSLYVDMVFEHFGAYYNAGRTTVSLTWCHICV